MLDKKMLARPHDRCPKEEVLLPLYKTDMEKSSHQGDDIR
jgi:hypothetical protein